MADDLSKAVEQAVREGVAARSRFYASMQEPDEQEFGQPATAAQIEGLEKTLGVTLAPSYRAFLALHNGWRMVTASMDLYSVEELLRVAKDSKTAKWRKVAVDAGDSFAAQAIVIGGSRFAASKLLLDPTQVDGEGEMVLIRHDKSDEDSYPSFLAYLLASTKEFAEAAGDIEGGFDFSNI